MRRHIAKDRVIDAHRRHRGAARRSLDAWLKAAINDNGYRLLAGPHQDAPRLGQYYPLLLNPIHHHSTSILNIIVPPGGSPTGRRASSEQVAAGKPQLDIPLRSILSLNQREYQVAVR